MVPTTTTTTTVVTTSTTMVEKNKKLYGKSYLWFNTYTHIHLDSRSAWTICHPSNKAEAKRQFKRLQPL